MVKQGKGLVYSSSSCRMRGKMARCRTFRLPEKKWLYLRIGSIIISGLVGVFIGFQKGVPQLEFNWINGFQVIVAVAGILLVLIWIQIGNPFLKWRKPSWSANPYLFSEPIQFFHFAAFQILTFGISILVTLLFNNNSSAAPLAAFFISTGFGVWIGVRLCMVIIRKKMEDN